MTYGEVVSKGQVAMNRRKKKKQQVDYAELVKSKVDSIDWQTATQRVKSKWQQLPKLHQRALMVLTPLLVALLIVPAPSISVEETNETPTQRVEISINTTSLSEQDGGANEPKSLDSWQEYEVKSGDTLAKVFRANGLDMSDFNALVRVEGNDKPLSLIKQGQLVRYKLADDGKLDILQLEKSGQSVMFFRLSDGGFGRSK